MGKNRVFDDAYSFLHMFVAMLLAYIDPISLISGSLIYIAYQKYQREEWKYKRGDFIEWLTGIVIGSLIRWILG